MMKTISWLVVMVTITVMLINAPTAMAGAYGTGAGQGYASLASTAIIPDGVIFHFTRIQPDARPMFYDEIDQQCILMFKCDLQSITYYLPGREI